MYFLFYTTIINSFMHSSYLLLFVSPINLISIIPGGGEFKFLRGFNPYIVNSVHHFRSRELGSAVENFLIQERMRNQVRIHLYIVQSLFSFLYHFLGKHFSCFPLVWTWLLPYYSDSKLSIIFVFTGDCRLSLGKLSSF